MDRIDTGHQAGMIDGHHYTEWAPEIDRLKRAGDLTAALAVCLRCVEAAERQAAVDGLRLPRGYTRDAAIIYRRLGDLDSEISVLERYLDRNGSGAEISERLAKAQALRAKRVGDSRRG